MFTISPFEKVVFTLDEFTNRKHRGGKQNQKFHNHFGSTVRNKLTKLEGSYKYMCGAFYMTSYLMCD